MTARVSSLGRLPEWDYRLLHDRRDHTLIWLTRGQGRAIVDGLRSGLGAHNALFIPAGRLFSLDIGAQALGLALHAPADTPFPDRPLHLRIRDGFAQAELTAHLDAMQREQTQARAMVDDALEAHARLVAVWLYRQHAAAAADGGRETAALHLMRLFCDALGAGFRSDRGVAAYAAALGVSATHLTRSARASCGMTAAAMIAERKLHEARRQLAAPELSVKRIAEGLGFHSAPYFTRFIRSHTGLSPTELRRGNRPPVRPGVRG
ncbi:helix-turn-helix transcriptional regulator [Salipiger aestuarii]|uniref:AraC family transcriptional activator of pobA n=1 Tax=Salipiger aestuarii TaxID=568098 RepID=A0A327XJ88_9RHOB|nr:AraC family transcriptional regulator [Salipiger aestuarii]KAA8606566.1 AraC family transcriptional regulator [Salipiger aestuarii]KAB2533157.1 AraC family transcriptional regulator [Salipiger aestuarii]RAK08087.1 AraC family transcriptional activator of pobA [Salipiger aestuarii]